ncbi:glutamine synthetase family protein [Streptomyces yaizuensis]|uniref:Glutamine synthetase family protein n=1 Tax=Streptomyces yaizuensis TaxID=2989713 RepID=A0ABQ5P8G7_9ACTN|nr:glutamine synthetase family protein [Streptomyces sp. YSPA8]GLF98883.1 glutamine synthetase family protein [Streptomyces sp. YSPA8]
MSHRPSSPAGGPPPGRLHALADDLTARGADLVRVLWSDLHGIARGKEIPVAELHRFDGPGLSFCQAVMVTDLAGIPLELPESSGGGWADAHARIDPDTLAVAAHAPGTALLLADVTDSSPDHAPLPLDPRGLLRRQTERLAARGLHPVAGPELEFYLLAPDPAAPLGWRRYSAYDTAGYTVGAAHDPDRLLSLLIRECHALGLGVLGGNQEFSGGQFEINHTHGPALRAADRAFLFKYTVKEIAAARGLRATFAGKPFADAAGSGQHVHLSLVDDAGANLFADPAADGGLRDLARSFLAGVLFHAPALSALLNPTVNAYKRLADPGALAPATADWGFDDRTAYARIPPERGDGTRIEIRGGDGAANPYLVIGALLAAGLDGVDRGLTPPPPLAPGERGGGPPLPGTLRDALDALDGDPVLSTALGPRFTEVFTAMKRAELARFERAVTDWEFHEYTGML